MVSTRSGKSTSTGVILLPRAISNSGKVLGSKRSKPSETNPSGVEIFCDSNTIEPKEPQPIEPRNVPVASESLTPSIVDENSQVLSTTYAKRLLDEGNGNAFKKPRVLGDATSSKLNSLSVKLSPSAKDVKKVCLLRQKRLLYSKFHK